MKEVQHLQKDMNVGEGKFAYKAISESKVTSEVRKSLIKHGLVFRQNKVKNEFIEKQEKDGGKVNWLHGVHISYKLIDVDAVEEKGMVPDVTYVNLEAIGTGIDPQDKASGKAQTYSYKYALLRLFAIPTGEDPDRKASVDSDGMMKASEKVFKDLIVKVKQGTVSADNIRNNFNLTDIQEQELKNYE